MDRKTFIDGLCSIVGNPKVIATIKLAMQKEKEAADAKRVLMSVLPPPKKPRAAVDLYVLDAVDYTFEDGPPDLGQVSPTERWEGLSADERQLYEERSSAETILWAEWLQQPQWVRQQAWQRQHEEERQQALQACEQQVLREQEDVWRPAWERGLAACKARLASTSVASFTIGPPASPRPRSRRKRARLDQVALRLDPAAFLETVFNEVLMELNGAELAPVLNVCQDWRRHGDDVLRIHSWIARHVELLELMARRETDSDLVARLLAHPEEAARNVGESIYSQVFEGGRPPHLPNNWPRGVYPLQLAIELGYSEQTIRQILFAAPMTLQEMSYYRTPKFEGSAPALHLALLRVDCPAVLEMIRGAPHAGGQMVRVGDVARCRPLHLAVARATVGLELVQALLSCHPKAVKEARVVAGAPQPALLPLQIAARSDASIEVLDVLRAAYPPERWPTDQLLRCSHGGPEEEEACARFSRPGVARGLRCERFLEAIRDGCSVEVIRTLCAANPLLAALPSDACDSFGGMALHVAAQHAAFAAVLHPLIDANPHALRYRNSNGDLPLHIACKRRVTTQGRASKVAMDAMIAVLLNAWPAAVTYSDLEYHLAPAQLLHGAHNPVDGAEDDESLPATDTDSDCSLRQCIEDAKSMGRDFRRTPFHEPADYFGSAGSSDEADDSDEEGAICDPDWYPRPYDVCGILPWWSLGYNDDKVRDHSGQQHDPDAAALYRHRASTNDDEDEDEEDEIPLSTTLAEALASAGSAPSSFNEKCAGCDLHQPCLSGNLYFCPFPASCTHFFCTRCMPVPVKDDDKSTLPSACPICGAMVANHVDQPSNEEDHNSGNESDSEQSDNGQSDSEQSDSEQSNSGQSNND